VEKKKGGEIIRNAVGGEGEGFFISPNSYFDGRETRHILPEGRRTHLRRGARRGVTFFFTKKLIPPYPNPRLRREGKEVPSASEGEKTEGGGKREKSLSKKLKNPGTIYVSKNPPKRKNTLDLG